LRSLVSSHRFSGAIATIATHRRRVKINFGVIQFDNDKEIIGYREKPTYDYFVSMGIYVFEPRVISYIPPNQYLDFPDLILKLIDAGERVVGYPFKGYWRDLGRPDDYEQAIEDIDMILPQILGEYEAVIV